jgi:hypothetical protein
VHCCGIAAGAGCVELSVANQPKIHGGGPWREDGTVLDVLLAASVPDGETRVPLALRTQFRCVWAECSSGAVRAPAHDQPWRGSAVDFTRRTLALALSASPSWLPLR